MAIDAGAAADQLTKLTAELEKSTADLSASRAEIDRLNSNFETAIREKTELATGLYLPTRFVW